MAKWDLQVLTYVDEATKDDFEECCTVNGQSVSARLRALIFNDVREYRNQKQTVETEDAVKADTPEQVG